MGPAIILRSAADIIEWAQHFFKGFYRLPRMGPTMLLGRAADVVEWAQNAP
jgi:hypothetical protein